MIIIIEMLVIVVKYSLPRCGFRIFFKVSPAFAAENISVSRAADGGGILWWALSTGYFSLTANLKRKF